MEPPFRRTAVIAAAFLVLHIAAGVILINAFGPTPSTTQEAPRASLFYDQRWCRI